MAIPHINSLYTLIKVDAANAEGDAHGEVTAQMNAQLSFFQKQHKPGNLTKPYDKIGMRTDDLVARIYTANPVCEEKRRLILGGMSREQFDTKFGAGRERFAANMTPDKLVRIFGMKSFPETYFHPTIARSLCATGQLTEMKTAKERLMSTAGVIFAAIDDAKAVAMMLGMSESHIRKRGKELYNEDTVEFTLLTFSYFGAKASGIREEDWFFYWRVFGSMMGLPPDRLHESYEVANARMKALHVQCPPVPNADSTRLLDVFVAGFLEDDSAIREACSNGCVSKRMEQFLRAKGRWPAGLVRSGD